MARITLVQKAAKDQGACGRCGTPIEKGSPYRHCSPGWRGRKLIRCMQPSCGFRQSELTTSLMAGVYAAQEDAEEALANLRDGGTLEDVQTVMEDCAGAAEEVAQQYTDAADAMGGAGEEMQEKADEIENWVNELQGFDPDEFKTEADPDDLDAVDEEDIDAAVDAAVELVGSLQL